MQALATFLREARKRANLTQQDIAGRLGVSRQAVTNWEKGKGIDYVHLLALSRLLEVDLGSALTDASPKVEGFAETPGDTGYARQQVNLVCEVDAAVLAEAKANQIDIPAVVTRALAEANLARRVTRWRDDNRDAISEANAELEQNGLWSDGLRLF
jgi:antitoxin CcdA